MTTEPIFSNALPSGNGHLLDMQLVEDEWQVRFISESRVNPQALWFNFQLTGLGGRAVRLTWHCADTNLGDSSQLDRDRPVLRVDGGDWMRVPEVEIVDTPDGRRQLVFETPGPCDTVQAAFCYPYGPDDLKATLDELGDAWQTTVIGLTGQGRELERLRLGGDVAGPRPGLYLTARQHCGETPGGLAIDGLLRFLAGDAPEAARFREEFDCWIVPFVDLDGTVNGDYGKDSQPWDFNRAWEVLAMRPEVHAVQRDLRRFADRTGPHLALDLHAPGHSTPDVFTHMPRDGQPYEQALSVQSFVDRMQDQFPELEPGSMAMPTRYASRWNEMCMISSWVWDYVDHMTCCYIEISYQSLAGKPLDIAGYAQIGGRIALASMAWLDEQVSK